MSTFAYVIKSECHCGNIHLELHSHHTCEEFTRRTCACGFCQQHGASWISDPEGEARVRFRNKDLVSFYRFGHKTADFIACRQCGVLMLSVCEIEGRLRAVLNATAMVQEIFPLSIQTNFYDEKVENRLERRKRNWTGSVIFDEDCT